MRASEQIQVDASIPTTPRAKMAPRARSVSWLIQTIVRRTKGGVHARIQRPSDPPRELPQYGGVFPAPPGWRHGGQWLRRDRAPVAPAAGTGPDPGAHGDRRQRLVRALDRPDGYVACHCRIPNASKPRTIHAHVPELDTGLQSRRSSRPLYDGSGCARCNGRPQRASHALSRI